MTSIDPSTIPDLPHNTYRTVIEGFVISAPRNPTPANLPAGLPEVLYTEWEDSERLRAHYVIADWIEGDMELIIRLLDTSNARLYSTEEDLVINGQHYRELIAKLAGAMQDRMVTPQPAA